MARIAAQSGDVLPGSSDIPNLDPLAGAGAPTPTPIPEPAAPAPPSVKATPPPPTPLPVETKPKSQVAPEPVKKGKKGKSDDPTG
jgi:hypothetical protein